MRCQTKWLGTENQAYEADIRGHKVIMDTKVEKGGKDLGPSPKELLLASICGCTAMDVVSILQKMRANLHSCEVHSHTSTTEGYPSIFAEVKLQYLIQAESCTPDQVLRAVSLSMTKYCGVSAMVVKASPMTYEVFLNDKKIGDGVANFEAAES